MAAPLFLLIIFCSSGGCTRGCGPDDGRRNWQPSCTGHGVSGGINKRAGCPACASGRAFHFL